VIAVLRKKTEPQRIDARLESLPTTIGSALGISDHAQQGTVRNIREGHVGLRCLTGRK
jgi:hypothetical protein